MKSSKNFILFFLVFSGFVIGSLIGELSSGIPALSWLNFGLRFGLDSPISLSLGVVAITLGFSINLTVSCIIFVLLSLFVGMKIYRW